MTERDELNGRRRISPSYSHSFSAGTIIQLVMVLVTVVVVFYELKGNFRVMVEEIRGDVRVLVETLKYQDERLDMVEEMVGLRRRLPEFRSKR